jgi:hypothetical protein
MVMYTEREEDYVAIDYYWSPSSRSWVIMRKDAQDNQIGAADYEPNKTMRDKTLKRLRESPNYKPPQ